MTSKLITVYIPTHNRSNMLYRAIRSVQLQTYDNIEIIICDDGSTDETYQLVNKLIESDDRIKYLRNEKPLGAPSARNLGIFNATGEYITGLDDDDEFSPNRIQELVSIYDDTLHSFVCSNIMVNYGSYRAANPIYSGEITLEKLGFYNIAGNQVFTKTEKLKNIGGFDTSLPAWQDYDTWFRLCLHYGNGYKIASTSYIQNVDHELGRITTGDKAKRGYELFVEKHSNKLTKKNKMSLLIYDRVNRGADISFKDLLQNFSMANLILTLKFKIKKRMPLVKSLVKYIR
ncbi:glycosyltransferase [Serratia fonticola]|uniref:glycosyltransferase n=1 Tax=Serratia fonticola TaxID=47917 RepID=UPI003AABEC14